MNTFFRSPTAGQNHPGKRKTTMKNETLPARLLTAAIKLSSPLRRGGVVMLVGLALGWLGAMPCAHATCEQGCDTTYNNTFLGNDALLANTTGLYNTATGGYALANNNVGSDNTASGFDALYKNTTGGYNTASGAFALEFNTTGTDNTASGYLALHQ